MPIHHSTDHPGVHLEAFRRLQLKELHHYTGPAPQDAPNPHHLFYLQNLMLRFDTELAMPHVLRPSFKMFKCLCPGCRTHTAPLRVFLHLDPHPSGLSPAQMTDFSYELMNFIMTDAFSAYPEPRTIHEDWFEGLFQGTHRTFWFFYLRSAAGPGPVGHTAIGTPLRLQQATRPLCRVPGCNKEVWEKDDGSFHDFCGKTCAQAFLHPPHPSDPPGAGQPPFSRSPSPPPPPPPPPRPREFDEFPSHLSGHIHLWDYRMVKVGIPGTGNPPRSWSTAYWRKCTSCGLLLTTSKESYLATLPTEHPVLALGSAAPAPLFCALRGCTKAVTQPRFLPPTEPPRDYTEYFCCPEHEAVDLDSDDDRGVCAVDGCSLLTSNTPGSMYCFRHAAPELPSTPPAPPDSSSALPGPSAP